MTRAGRTLANLLYLELGPRMGPLFKVLRDVAKFPSPQHGSALDEHWTQVEDLRAALERVAEKHAEPFWVKGPPDYERLSGRLRSEIRPERPHR